MLFCDQGTLTRRTIVFMDRVSKKRRRKKKQSLSQSNKLKTKLNLFYLFLYYGETQRATVARRRCSLTPNLCTDMYKKAHKDKILGSGPDLRGTFSSCISQVFWGESEGKTLIFFFLNNYCFISAFGVLDI